MGLFNNEERKTTTKVLGAVAKRFKIADKSLKEYISKFLNALQEGISEQYDEDDIYSSIDTEFCTRHAVYLYILLEYLERTFGKLDKVKHTKTLREVVIIVIYVIYSIDVFEDVIITSEVLSSRLKIDKMRFDCCALNIATTHASRLLDHMRDEKAYNIALNELS